MMNASTKSQLLMRLLQKEICYRSLSRNLQTSAALRATKSSKEDGELSEKKETDADESSSKSETAKGLFDALAGMKVSKRLPGAGAGVIERGQGAGVIKKEQGAGARSRMRATSKFKTAEALKDAMTQAAKTVSKAFPDSEKTESDLVKQLRRYEEAKAAGEMGDTEAVSSLLTGLKVESKAEATGKDMKQQRTKEKRDGDSVSSILENMMPTESSERLGRGEPRQRLGVERMQTGDGKRFVGRRLLFKGRLGIFQPMSSPDSSDVVDVKTLWDQEEESELSQLRKMEMRHGFDEMMEMTRDGKLWKYPIDNEQGLEEEQAVGFHEHVLLEDLIEDFPKTGPIRDFMELVTIGLSKNPYFTVQQKKDHIDWFRNYFKDKEEVLREAESLPKEFSFAQ